MDETISETINLVESVPADAFIRGVKKSDALRRVLDALYQLQAQQNTSIRKKLKKGRPSKIKQVEVLDAEQIWALVQLWDGAVINWTEGMVATLTEANFNLHLLNDQDADEEDGDEIEEEEEENGGNDDFDDIGDKEEEDDDDDDMDDEDLDGGGDDNDDEAVIATSAPSSKVVDPILDDEHFRISEMDEFAEHMEVQLQKQWDKEDKLKKKMMEGRGLDEEEEDDDMDSYDSNVNEEDDTEFVKKALYGDADDDDNEEDEDDEDDDVNVRYGAFFDPPPGSRAAGSASSKTAPVKKKLTKRDLAKAELAKKIAELESEAIGDKPWDLKGEAKASSRPKDSLLEKEDLDIDFLKRSVPSLTPEVAAEIEDVILKRYMDAKFNDVEVKNDREKEKTRTTSTLSNEKSKEGLGETYAQDFAEKVLDHTPQAKVALEKDRVEIREMFEKLCQKLDALSSLNYTPKLPQVKDSNRPPDVAAVHMEDIVPTTETGDVAQTAPEEVERRLKGLGKSRTEMEPEERRAQRRRAKEATKKRNKADGVIIPVSKKKIKTVTDATTGASSSSDMNWTSSAQVFRRLEKSKVADL